MYIGDVKEAVPLVDRVLSYMLVITATRGRVGSDMRTAIGDFIANAATLLRNDLAGPPLADVFDKARLAGITLNQLDAVRSKAVAEAPKTIGATLVKNALINFTLVVEGRLLAATTFVSHEDAEAMKLRMNDAFAPMEEIAADDMDQMTYQALVRLHAAITFFLIETARPLPRMLGFQFYSPSLPTLIIAYRLYANAGRADEIRAENKVVHPAFCRPSGKALSN
jgi:prophage DNA circulation protein